MAIGRGVGRPRDFDFQFQEPRPACIYVDISRTTLRHHDDVSLAAAVHKPIVFITLAAAAGLLSPLIFRNDAR
jgi:hypothetical protein